MSNTKAVMLWVAAALSILTVARSLSVDASQRVRASWVDANLPELCSFRRIFAVDCPGCGMTRSFIHTSRLHLTQAWAIHPAGTLLCLSLALSVPLRLFQWWHAKKHKVVYSFRGWELGWIVAIIILMLTTWSIKTLAAFHP